MIRVALVGAGTMGSFHARVISSSGRATLTTVVDAHETTGRAVAERYGARWAPRLEDVTDIDAVVIAASTEAHDALARHVLNEDLPLLIEKPVVNDYAQTLEIVGLAQHRDLPLVCGLLERYNPAVVAAKELIREPLHVTATRHSPYAPRIKTGVAWDLLIHDIDLAIGILGTPPTSSVGSLGSFHPSSVPGAEDVASATLSFPGGQLAQLSASRIGQKKDRMLTIHELDRMIEVDLLRRDVTVYRHVSAAAAREDGRGYRQQTSIEIPEITNAREPLAAQFDHFVDIIEGIADAGAERQAILPSHEAVARLFDPAFA